MNKIKSATKKIKRELNSDHISTDREKRLASDLELITLLRETPDILTRYPEIMCTLDIPHESGKAVSLIERQVSVLREQNRVVEQRLHRLMDVARDNERLAKTLHHLAINLLGADDIDDVISIVRAMLNDELGADIAVIKLFTDNPVLIAESSGLFVSGNDETLNAFRILLQEKNTVCGISTEEQKKYLFDDHAVNIRSIAIVPLVARTNLGLIGLGSKNSERFDSSLDTHFLSQAGELISASLAVHLENKQDDVYS